MKWVQNIPVPGMRVVKTAIAVFLCLVIVGLIGHKSYSGYSAIVAIVCMQKGVDDSLNVSKNRIIGTIIGAIFGIFTFKMIEYFGIVENIVLPYILVAIMMIVLMMVIILLNKQTVTAITCIIFLSVAVLRDSSVDVWFFAFRRVIDTLVGILISLMVNLLISDEFIKKHNPMTK